MFTRCAKNPLFRYCTREGGPDSRGISYFCYLEPDLCGHVKTLTEHYNENLKSKFESMSKRKKVGSDKKTV